MSEVHPNFAREWIEFIDPANPAELFKCDLTWLTSYWTCIFGNGCKGVEADQPDNGCCTDGAYYSGEEDEARVLKVAARLTPAIWQFYDEAQPKKKGGSLKISETGLDKDRKTRKVDNSCIFLNRKGFARDGYVGNHGCALHQLALDEKIHFVETKPDVCWQLPIRRSFEIREFGDGKVSVTVIGEYERLAWGEGGADFDWYCTSNTEAHVGREPVYLSNKAELVALMGAPAYQELARYCDNRMAAIKASRRKTLPLFVVHPATVQARS